MGQYMLINDMQTIRLIKPDRPIRFSVYVHVLISLSVIFTSHTCRVEGMSRGGGDREGDFAAVGRTVRYGDRMPPGIGAASHSRVPDGA